MARSLTSSRSEVAAHSERTKCRHHSAPKSSRGRRYYRKILCKSKHVNNWNEFEDLRVIHFNMRSWNKNKDELIHELEVLKPHVVLLQETWLTGSKELKVPGYFIIRRDRTRSRKGIGEKIAGGGLVIMVRCCVEAMEYMKIEQLPDLHFPGDDTTEVLQVKVHWNERSIVFSNVYIPPVWGGEGESRSQNFEAENVFSKCKEGFLDCSHVICGDFNAHHPSWDNVDCHELVFSDEGGALSDQIGDDIFEWSVENEMIVANDPAVRTWHHSGGGRSSSPDVSLYSNDLEINSWRVYGRLGSDHLPVSFKISILENSCRPRSFLKTIRKTKYSFKKADWVKFNSIFTESMASSNQATRRSNRHQRYRNLVNVFHLAASSIPRGARLDAMSWWDDELNDLKDRKDKCALEAQDSVEMMSRYRDLCKQLNVLINLKKNEAWRTFASSLK